MTGNFDSVLNNKYKVYTSPDKEADTSKKTSGIYRLFIIRGQPNFEELHLKDEYRWRKIHGLTSQQRKEFLADNSDYRYAHAEETRAYSGPQGIAVAYLNHETGTHEMDIHIQNQADNEDSMKAVQSMFELELGVTLYPEGTKIEDPIHSLVTKLKSN
jgi:hypothetical protein